jgi:hypothetical protein
MRPPAARARRPSERAREPQATPRADAATALAWQVAAFLFSRVCRRPGAAWRGVARLGRRRRLETFTEMATCE